MIAGYAEMNFWSPILGCKATRLSCADELGREYFMIVPRPSTGWREEKARLLDLIAEAIESGCAPEKLWPSMPEAEYEVLDFSTTEGFPPDVEVRAWPMGIITMHRGDDQATIDTTDMTRDEVVRSLYVGIAQLDNPVVTGGNRLQRRRAGAMNGHG